MFPSLTWIISGSKLRKRRRICWTPTLLLARWAVFQTKLKKRDTLRPTRRRPYSECVSLMCFAVYAGTQLSKASTDDPWTSSVKKKCCSAGQSGFAAVSCQLFSQVSILNTNTNRRSALGETKLGYVLCFCFVLFFKERPKRIYYIPP